MPSIAEPEKLTVAVRETPLPEGVRDLGQLDRIDYFDSYLLTGVPDRTAEQWARAMIEDSPAPMRTRLVIGWTALGLDLTLPTSDKGVLGWRIAHQTDEAIVLSAAGRLGLSGNLIFALRPEGLQFVTLIKQSNAVARSAWAKIESGHQAIVQSLLRQAGKRELGRQD